MGQIVQGDGMKKQQHGLPWLVLGLLTGCGLSGLASWGIGALAICSRCWRWGVAFSLGLAWAQCWMVWQLSFQFPVDVAPQVGWLEGEIIALPQVQEQGGVRLTVAVKRSPWSVREIQLRDYSNAQRALPLYQAGQHWRWLVRMRAPEGLHNFSLRRARYWGWAQGIDGAASVVRGQAYWLSAQAPSWLGQWSDWRAQLRHRLLADMAHDAVYRGVMVALAVGDQAAIPASQWDLFNALGLTHLISISGSHVTALGGWLGWLIWQIWRRVPRLAARYPAQQAAVWGSLPLVWGYVALAGGSLPAVRSGLMFSAFAWVWWRRRAWSLAQVWWGCLALILIFQVNAVWKVGFWLSFWAVGVLLLQGSLHGLRGWWRAQWAISVALAPWLLWSFDQIPWWSLVANAVGIPLIGGVITPLALLGLFFPPLAAWGEAILAVLMEGLQQLTQVARVWQAPALPGWLLLGWMAAGLWVILPRGWVQRRVAWLAFAPICWYQPAAVSWGTVRVTVLDVGQGLSVLFETQHQRILYDTGQAWATASAVIPSLHAAGVVRLEGLVLSHADSDHAGGANLIRETFSPRWQLASFAPNHPAWRQEKNLRRCQAGQTWWVDGVRWEVLHPREWPEGEEADNAASCVLRVQAHNGQAVLVSGDLPQAQEEALVASSPVSLRSEVLIVGHHGSRTSTSAAWLDATGAHEAVIAAGRWNRYHHPHPSVLDRLHAHHLRVWRTDCQGAVRFLLGKNTPVAPDGVRTATYCPESVP